MKQRARELRKTPTEAEQRLWQKPKRRQIGGVKFRRQHSLGPYIVDFACLERRLVVEVDGGQHVEQADADEQRTRWLESQGYTVLRFWNNEVLGQTEHVAQAVFDCVEEKASSV